MSDDLLSRLGRKQREDLDAEDQPSSSQDDALARPFDEDERASILDAVFDRVDAAPEVGPSAEAATKAPAPSNVIELAPRRRGALIGSLLAVAAAATLVWWGWPDGRSEQRLVASVPAYAFTQLGGGIAHKRSAPNDSPGVVVPELELRADSNIDWVLTPAEPTADPIGVALLARSDAGATQFVAQLDVEVSEQGAVRLRGRLDQHIALAAGEWTLTLFIAEPQQLPSNADVAVDGAGPWQNLAVRVIIVADE